MNIVEQARNECKRMIRMHKRFPVEIGLTRNQLKEFRAARRSGEDTTIIYKGESRQIPVALMKDVNYG